MHQIDEHQCQHVGGGRANDPPLTDLVPMPYDGPRHSTPFRLPRPTP